MERVQELLREIWLAIVRLATQVWNYLKEHWKIFVAAAIAVAVVILLVTIGRHRHYKDYTVTSSVKLAQSTAANYTAFDGNILMYSADGASYTDTAGTLLWNETYEMEDPRTYSCGSYLIIYDHTGTEIHLVTKEGSQQVITTHLPIVCAEVSSTGDVAVLMQKDKTGYLRVYNLDGNTSASGEVHLKNTGYPLTIALSHDGQQLAAAYANLNDGQVKTTLIVYDFTAAGRKQKDNIVAKYNYKNTLIPRLTYVGDGRLVAFAENRIYLFNNHTKPEVIREIDVEDEIRSVYYCDDYFGYVSTRTNQKGRSVLTLHTMNASGRQICDGRVSLAYQRAQMLPTGDLVLTYDKGIAIYNLSGVEKFRDTLASTIANVLPQDGSRDYIFVLDGRMELAHIR